MQQVGVVYEGHHAFDLRGLISTLCNISIEEVTDQFKAIFSWAGQPRRE